MIISHQHRFIFIAIPKTGTHAIRFALREHLGQQDEEQVGLFKQSTLHHPELAKLGHGHITAHQGKMYLPCWKEYFKFSFVRNPYARLVSFGHFFYSKHPVMQKLPTLHLKKLLLFPPEKKRLWFQPQTDFLYDQEGNLQVNFVGKVEELQGDYSQVCTKLHLPDTTLEKVNASSHRAFQQYFDEELAEMAFHYYQKDFIAFDYAEDSWKTP